MTTALILFFADLAIFAVALLALKRSTDALAVVMPIVIYAVVVGTVWVKPDAWALPIALWAAACATVVLPGEGLSRLTDALGRHRLFLYLLSTIAVAALVLVLLPVRTFRTSPGELTVGLDQLVATNARQAMTIVYVAALLYALALTSRMRTALTLLAIGTLAVAIVYAYVMPFGYPAMAGLAFEVDTVPAAVHAVRLFVDGLVVMLVALTVRGVFLAYGLRPLLLTVILVAVSLFGMAAIDVRNEAVGGAGGDGARDTTPDRPLRFSATHPNVLVIMLDRFMGSHVESALARRPELATELKGFTWYPRTASAGSNSIVGVHPIFGGYDYVPDAMNARRQPLRDLSVEAFSILPYNFSRRGYRVNVVNPRGLGFTMEGDCSFLDMDGVYCGHIPAAVTLRTVEAMDFPLSALTASNYTDLLVMLGSMRAAPYGLKETIRRRGAWRPFLNHSAAATFTQWAELRALPDVTDTSAAESNYNVVSNILPHEPTYLGDNCTPQQSAFEVSAGELRRRGHPNNRSLQHANAAECSLTIVARYFQHLQQAGVYDNTTIVIVSDHGIVGPVPDHSTRAKAGGTDANLYVRSRSVLLVKERGATGTLQTSERFLPNAEVPRIVCEDIGGCVNPYLGNTPIATMGRDDPWVVSTDVPWNFTAHRPDAFVINQQYELTGKDPFDVKGWKRKTRATSQ